LGVCTWTFGVCTWTFGAWTCAFGTSTFTCGVWIRTCPTASEIKLALHTAMRAALRQRARIPPSLVQDEQSTFATINKTLYLQIAANAMFDEMENLSLVVQERIVLDNSC